MLVKCCAAQIKPTQSVSSCAASGVWGFFQCWRPRRLRLHAPTTVKGGMCALPALGKGRVSNLRNPRDARFIE